MTLRKGVQFKRTLLATAMTVSAALVLTACNGDDGRDGIAGMDGAPGTNGLDGVNSLVRQSSLQPGNSQCFDGGVQIDSGIDDDGDGVLAETEVDETRYLCSPTRLNEDKHFNRIASFAVCSQLDVDCDDDTSTSAEIIAASADGQTLIYSDSPGQQVGFVDITDPQQPSAVGVLAMGGEPTSVAVAGSYALVAVNTSADFINTSGELKVVDIATRSVVATLPLAGQPDSVAVSPDGHYAAIAIENERDEDLGEGVPPQLPAGSLDIVDISGSPETWAVRNVVLTGLADLYPSDPEPEYVDINSDNIAVLSMQENNHLVLIDLSDGSIVNHFSAGSVDLSGIDTEEESPALISQTDSLSNVLREPDGVSWLSSDYFVTANEGDLDGGSRSFSVFNTEGEVIFDSGAELDQLAVRFGHYPDSRSGNKGNEPENAEFAVFGTERYAFINAERSSLVFVYDVADLTQPLFKQALPAALGPEGALAIPQRNLLVVASEEDSREDGFRAAVNIYQYQSLSPQYPTIRSADRLAGTPIAWSALSGLSADPRNGDVLYAVEDSYYQQSRIFSLNVAALPAVLSGEMRVLDSAGVLAGLPVAALADASVDEDDASRINVFDRADLAAMINADHSVNLDLEGIAAATDGGFWLVSEGEGTVGDSGRPVNSGNLLIKTDAAGVIEQVVQLPSSINDIQLRFGFEGVAVEGDKIYVAFQRAWNSESGPRIGVYDTVAGSWSFLFYPLDAVASQHGGWVGLSDISSLGGGDFMVIERDNQAGPDAVVKRLYRFSVSGLVDGDTVSKTLVRDVLDDMAAPGGLVAEKLEGLAVTRSGEVYIVNDNDGVDDNSGETQLIRLGNIL